MRTVRRVNGPAVRAFREARLISRTELAKKIGFSASYLSNIENQRADAPVRVITLIAEALNVPRTELVADPALARALELTTKAA